MTMLLPRQPSRLSCKCILLAQSKLLTPQDPQVLLCQAILPPVDPQLTLVYGLIPPHLQDFAFSFKCNEILVGSFLQSQDPFALHVFMDEFLKYEKLVCFSRILKQFYPKH